MKLRPYQQEAVDAILADASKYKKDNLLVAMPTGCGKSLVIAGICKEIADRGGRVLVLHRTKELVGQNNERFCQFDPQGIHRSGVYSAGIGIRQTGEQVTFAGVQSVYKRAAEFGKIDAIVVDEAHQVGRNENSQYQTLIRGLREINPKCRFFGLTATPYRMDGVLHGGIDCLFDRVSYSAPLADMFDQGYLTPPETLPVEAVDMTGVRKTAGDFNQSEMQSRFLGRSITREIYETCNKHGHKSIIVYASGVAHAELIHHELQALGEDSNVITGETLPLIRATTIDLFKNGKRRWLVNVDCLTTGFDASNIDCVVVARATESAGLFMQIVGRGTRLHAGKEKFHVIDYGGNIDRFGAIDCEDYGKDFIKDPTSGEGEAPKKVCPKCFEIVHASALTCNKCEYIFPKREKVLISTKAEIRVKATMHTVVHEDMKRWKGKELEELGPDNKPMRKPDTMIVQYKLKANDTDDITSKKRWAREWVCIEHKKGSYARQKAEQWWKERSNTHCPDTIDEALALISAGALAKTLTLEIRPQGKFDRITKSVVADKPDCGTLDLEELPF